MGLILQENGEESLEELQELFDEMFRGDMEALASTSQPAFSNNYTYSASSTSTSYVPSRSGSAPINKWNSTEMHGSGSTGFDCHLQDFCFGVSLVHVSLVLSAGRTHVLDRIVGKADRIFGSDWRQMEQARGLNKRKAGTGGGTRGDDRVVLARIWRSVHHGVWVGSYTL